MIQWCMSRHEVTIAVRVRTGASRTHVGGRHDGPWGPALVIAVNAPAVDGRATDAALRATADALGLRRREVSLRSGPRSRDKVFTVADPPSDFDERLRALRDGTP
jgi:uncharacterized protein YggU (UPF0235/DUF167 family)